jgi:hypothetical protein
MWLSWLSCHSILKKLYFVKYIWCVVTNLAVWFNLNPKMIWSWCPCNCFHTCLQSLIWIKIREERTFDANHYLVIENFHYTAPKWHVCQFMDEYCIEVAIKVDLCRHFVQICYEWIAMARRQNGCCYLADHIYWTHIDCYRWVNPSDWLMFEHQKREHWSHIDWYLVIVIGGS